MAKYLILHYDTHTGITTDWRRFPVQLLQPGMHLFARCTVQDKRVLKAIQLSVFSISVFCNDNNRTAFVNGNNPSLDGGRLYFTDGNGMPRNFALSGSCKWVMNNRRPVAKGSIPPLSTVRLKLRPDDADEWLVERVEFFN
jgi:hypothetical protein